MNETRLFVCCSSCRTCLCLSLYHWIEIFQGDVPFPHPPFRPPLCCPGYHVVKIRHWQSNWTVNAIWEMLYLAILVAVCVLLRPSMNTQRCNRLLSEMCLLVFVCHLASYLLCKVLGRIRCIILLVFTERLWWFSPPPPRPSVSLSTFIISPFIISQY